MSTKENPKNKLFSSFIFDYEQELVSIWKRGLETKISKVLNA
jgi:hypothetical protein